MVKIMSEITSSAPIVTPRVVERESAVAPKKSQGSDFSQKSTAVVSEGAGDRAIDKIALESKLADKAVDVTSVTISPKRLSELVEQLKASMPEKSGLQFRIDEVLDRPIVSVIDEASGAVIRQLPSEEVVRAAHNIEYMRGILFDDYS